ncbi:hypothetical protein GOODEAATRI_006535, partial [Goodea atripinnis]
MSTEMDLISVRLQLLESIAQLKAERDCYVERIQEEGRVWKDKTEQLLAQLSRLCTEQETRLGDLERQVESQAQEEEDRRRMLEDVQSDKATISRALTQNRTLKDQLAELQNGFVKLVRPKNILI